MKLEFGNPAHIALAQMGAIPKEAENEKTKIEEEVGCTEGCDHCEETSYRCGNCGWHDDNEDAILITDNEGKDRCKKCKFLIE